MNTSQKQPVFPAGNEATLGPYSPGLTLGDLVFVSGQLPIDPQTHKIAPGGIEEQTAQTLTNIKRILEAADCSLDDCVKITIHLTNLANFDSFNKTYARFFGKPYPTRTTVQSGLLSDFLVEIDAIALRGSGAQSI